METKKIVMGVISIAVAIIVLMSMIPIFTDAGASEDTFVNRGYFYVDSIEEDESITYHFEDGTLTINGTEVPSPSDNTYPDGITIFFTEHITVRMDGSLMRIKGQVNVGCTALDLTITNSTITGTYTATNTSTANWTYTKFTGMVTSETNRVMSQPVPQYVNSDSLIETTGFTRAVGDYYVIHVSGSIDDGVTVNLYTQGSGTIVTTVTVSNIQINYSPVNGYEDLYLVDNITFTLTKDDAISNVTYSIYTIPAEVTAERSAHASPVESTLIGLIPLLMMVGILLTAVGLFIAKYRKN